MKFSNFSIANNEHAEKEIRKTIPFTVASKSVRNKPNQGVERLQQ
jgi:hypothetical protein